MNVNKLLPIGSVVHLNGAKKKLMIFGVGQTNKNDNVDYDYIGVAYPEGNMGEGSQFLFNHRDIDSVIFRGFENEERTAFIKMLGKYYEQNP